MKRTCQRLQRILAEHGPTALREDEAAQEHLADCADCFAVLEALAELDAALGELPSHDAPDELVESLLARPELRATVPAETGPASRLAALRSVFRRSLPRLPRVRWQWVTAAVALMTTIAVLGLWNRSPRQGMDFLAEPELSMLAEALSTSEERQYGTSKEEEEELQKQLRSLAYLGGGDAADDEAASASPVPDSAPAPAPKKAISTDQRAGRRAEKKTKTKSKSDERVFGNRKNVERDLSLGNARLFESETPLVENLQRGPEEGFEKGNESALQSQLPGPGATGDEAVRAVDGVVITDMSAVGSSPTYYNFDAFKELQVATGAGDASVATSGEVGGKDRYQPKLGFFDADESGRYDPAPRRRARDFLRQRDPAPRRRARDFLRQRAAAGDLRFQPATGYWSNTYVPGDPVFRHLQARLLGRDRGALQAYSESELRLHDAARQTTQPFDPPANAALAVYLHADRRQIRGETRMLVQVGLKGTERHSGRRPTMNVSVVLDAGGEITAETAATLRALVIAFGQAREPGDRFRLVVAERPGGVAVGPDDFRHGPLTLAVERLFAGGEEPTGVKLGLVDAMRTAIAEVSRTDDPTTPLGSSVVVLLTSRPLGADTGTLRQLAHRSAVAGVPVSVVGVGGGVRLDELDTIALAGQGNRRLIHIPREAPDLVARELSAVSRVIARAVRLRIRLAPGVRLVDVVGSRRLDTVRAEQVREAERSIDQRLSRNLGIKADRGDDEAGIQIVIPSFYAGDAHVVLLDVVASGVVASRGGAIADVRVRYKDLVHMENGQARAQLTLRRGDSESESPWTGGPLERNVIKNLLALRLRDVLEQAGTRVAGTESAIALQQLSDFRQLLEGLGVEVKGLEQDADLMRDVAMLDEYIQLLAAAEQPDQLLHLGESMRYAGRLKVLPRPVPAGEM